MATFPFLASDCSSFPLHFQLARNCTAAIYLLFITEEQEQRVGSEEGAFSGTSAAGEMESFCQLHSCFLSPVIICSSLHLKLPPSAACMQLISGCVLIVWDVGSHF